MNIYFTFIIIIITIVFIVLYSPNLDNFSIRKKKDKLRVGYYNFWKNFKGNDFILTKILNKYFNVELVDYRDNPDVLICSVFGDPPKNIEAKRKVFYTGENLNKYPKYKDYLNKFDFSFTFDHNNHPNHFRFPHWVLHDLREKVNKKNINIRKKKNFCAFVASNNVPIRTNFINKLSKYKKINCGGKSLNNVGQKVNNKINFQKKHKFSICFENSSTPGYCTEKLFQGFQSNTLPIYWGDPLVEKDFNKNTFINYNDFKSEEDLIEYIKIVDKDDNLYNSYFKKPIFSKYWQKELENKNKFEKKIAELISGKKLYVTSGYFRNFQQTSQHFF